MCPSRLTILPALIGFMLLAGCQQQRVDQLESRAQELVRERQQESLGPFEAQEPFTVPRGTVDAELTRASSAKSPLTQNPPAEELPAKPRPPEAASTFSADHILKDDPSAVKLNLEQAVGYAIGHSRPYRNQREELFIAALNVLVEKHLWGPRFFHTATAQVSGTPVSGENDHALEVINSFTVSQRLPYGGTVSATALVNFVDNLTADNASPQDSQSAAAVFNLSVPLLRGAGATVAQEPLIQAYRNLTYEARGFERFRREYFVDIATAYYNLLQLQAAIRNVQRQVSNFEWLQRRTEALAQAGRRASFEAQRTQQQVIFARNNLINSVESYNAQLDAFKLLIGMPVSQKLQIVPSELVVPTPEADRDASILTALKLRLDLQTSLDQVDDARRKVAIARNQTLPDLDLKASLNLPTDPAERFPQANLDPASGDYNLALTFDSPLDRTAEAALYRKSLINLERAQRSHSLLSDQVALQVRRAIRQIEQARLSLTLQNRNIEVAQKRVRGVMLRLQELGPRDFIEAQGDLLSAENRRDSALRDLRVNVLQYLLDSGQMRVDSQGRWLPPAKLQGVPGDPATLPREMTQPLPVPEPDPGDPAQPGQPAQPAIPANP